MVVKSLSVDTNGSQELVDTNGGQEFVCRH